MGFGALSGLSNTPPGGAAGHDQYKAWASLLKTDYGLYMVGGSHTETSIEFNEGAVGCRVSRKRYRIVGFKKIVFN